MKSFFQKKIYALKKTSNKAFTLIELLVTITIFVILTGIVLYSQNGFNSSILLSNLAYDTALTIRQAQTYGVNTNESAVNTFPSYGVSFDTSTATNQQAFVLFADTVNGVGQNSPDGIYDEAVTSCPANDPECLQKYSITRGSFIKSLCVGSQTACTTVSNLTILFTRPNPNAIMYTNTGNFTNPSLSPNPITAPASYAQIVVSSATGATSTIVVTGVGQIYIQ